MDLLSLSPIQKERLIGQFQNYFNDELSMDLGQFDVEFLLSFIEKNLGSAYYNKGLNDAQALMLAKVEILTESVVELERPCAI
ncbi:DUF2164 domain-containing protein [Thalassotalea eurytherma]|uniref:DUF2164 domain-containing protein n=1 Tax=Thalassotalea eurytherma TaxID=1144278 RepID=A0ABQ6GZW8_9GAMM|nr:DUF2164 domain-containing protein [Thalassotalea eurytherma]GLX81402.1 hypothetical protein theurythT_08540 [Thalassotalea eurytherma]